MIIRLFFFLLVFANLIFFAWTQGYLGASDESREPQRLAQQIHAEKLRILRDVPTAAVKTADMACRLVSGLNVAEAEALKAAVETAGGEAKVSPVPRPPIYLVLITDLANQAAAEKKVGELTRFGVQGHSSVPLKSGRYEIVFGSFPTEPAAREFLQGIAKRGIKSARLDKREQPILKSLVETRAPATTLLQQLPKLIAPYADATLGECAT